MPTRCSHIRGARFLFLSLLCVLQQSRRLFVMQSTFGNGRLVAAWEQFAHRPCRDCKHSVQWLSAATKNCSSSNCCCTAAVPQHDRCLPRAKSKACLMHASTLFITTRNTTHASELDLPPESLAGCCVLRRATPSMQGSTVAQKACIWAAADGHRTSAFTLACTPAATLKQNPTHSSVLRAGDRPQHALPCLKLDVCKD